MFVVGLTGGIGSGKTAASDYLASLGVVVVDADQVSRQVVEPGKPALKEIRKRFGDEVLREDGTLNRPALREIVFADRQARADLERITHPAIGQEIRRQLKAARSPYTVLVSPLLLETDQYSLVDRVLLIDVPEALQRTRTAQRDGVPESQVEAIMQAQMSREHRREKANDIVVNDDSLEALQRQLDTLHHKYLELASRHG